ncbi:cation:proton antiporter [Snodgrassella sp. B3882]|uniref:cation:proton antiporter domain-containing protein n=1 Tax=Snodgrassella sp. B3882 TaxID=2818037 RepID=UPI002269FEF6|nr:cation:proton antiporter [Snodgrassella sp. B3882]MCX8744550.1 cation:proton antiporter [Snodgrassella sp. B3882]
MHHSFPLVETIVGGLFFAFILGFAAQKLRMPPLVGYLFAGIIVGPYTHGFTADMHLSQQLAELGVILLMFGVGLHFSFRDLWTVKKVAIPGALIQIIMATLLGWGLAWLAGWGTGAGIVFGLALSCASTVVLIAALQRWNLGDSTQGRISTGWLIVEDIAMVFVLVMIPALAPILSGQGDVSSTEVMYLLGKTSIQIIAFVVIMLLLGRKIIPWSLHIVVGTGNSELFRLAVIAIALGCAILANYLFGVSFALGAFFAGTIISETSMNHTAEDASSGLREFFTVLFFVSVGMLFDPSIIIREPLLLMATLLVVIIGKGVGAFMIVRLLRYPVQTALTIAIALAQIGEFSFMIASLGSVYKIIPQLASDLILGSALISIICNPFLFVWLNRYLHKPSSSEMGTSSVQHEVDLLSAKPHAKLASPIKPISIYFADENMVIAPEVSEHTVIVGAGSIGQEVLKRLQLQNETVYVQENRLDIVAQLRAQQIPVAYGHALSEGMLDAVFVATAKNLIITIQNKTETIAIIEAAKAQNPHLQIIVFSHNEDDKQLYLQAGATNVVDNQIVLANEIMQVLM